MSIGHLTETDAYNSPFKLLSLSNLEKLDNDDILKFPCSEGELRIRQLTSLEHAEMSDGLRKFTNEFSLVEVAHTKIKIISEVIVKVESVTPTSNSFRYIWNTDGSLKEGFDGDVYGSLTNYKNSVIEILWNNVVDHALELNRKDIDSPIDASSSV